MSRGSPWKSRRHGHGIFNADSPGFGLPYVNVPRRSPKTFAPGDPEVDMLDASLKKKLVEDVRTAREGSFLYLFRDIVDRKRDDVSLPPSHIPPDYHIHSISPLYHPNYKKFNVEEDTSVFSSLEFPSMNPSRRIEVYFLAQYLDETLHRPLRYEKELTEEDIKATFNEFDIAFSEITRQLMNNCAERGLLLEGLYSRLRHTCRNLVSQVSDVQSDTDERVSRLTARITQLKRELADEKASNGKSKKEIAELKLRYAWLKKANQGYIDQINSKEVDSNPRTLKRDVRRLENALTSQKEETDGAVERLLEEVKMLALKQRYLISSRIGRGGFVNMTFDVGDDVSEDESEDGDKRSATGTVGSGDALKLKDRLRELEMQEGITDTPSSGGFGMQRQGYLDSVSSFPSTGDNYPGSNIHPENEMMGPTATGGDNIFVREGESGGLYQHVDENSNQTDSSISRSEGGLLNENPIVDEHRRRDQTETITSKTDNHDPSHPSECKNRDEQGDKPVDVDRSEATVSHHHKDSYEEDNREKYDEKRSDQEKDLDGFEAVVDLRSGQSHEDESRSDKVRHQDLRDVDVYDEKTYAEREERERNLSAIGADCTDDISDWQISSVHEVGQDNAKHADGSHGHEVVGQRKSDEHRRKVSQSMENDQFHQQKSLKGGAVQQKYLKGGAVGASRNSTMDYSAATIDGRNDFRENSLSGDASSSGQAVSRKETGDTSNVERGTSKDETLVDGKGRYSSDEGKGTMKLADKMHEGVQETADISHGSESTSVEDVTRGRDKVLLGQSSDPSRMESATGIADDNSLRKIIGVDSRDSAQEGNLQSSETHDRSASAAGEMTHKRESVPVDADFKRPLPSRGNSGIRMNSRGIDSAATGTSSLDSTPRFYVQDEYFVKDYEDDSAGMMSSQRGVKEIDEAIARDRTEDFILDNDGYTRHVAEQEVLNRKLRVHMKDHQVQSAQTDSDIFKLYVEQVMGEMLRKQGLSVRDVQGKTRDFSEQDGKSMNTEIMKKRDRELDVDNLWDRSTQTDVDDRLLAAYAQLELANDANKILGCDGLDVESSAASMIQRAWRKSFTQMDIFKDDVGSVDVKKQASQAPVRLARERRTDNEFCPQDKRLIRIMKLENPQAGRPTTKSWLCRFVSSMYKDKIKSDKLNDRENIPRASLPQFLLEYLKEQYGTRKLVDIYVGRIVATCKKYLDDPRLALFLKFLSEEKGQHVLNLFLRIQELLEQTRDVYSLLNPADDGANPSNICFLRCEAVVPLVFPSEDVDDFTERLQEKATPITPSDVQTRRDSAPLSIQEDVLKIRRIGFLLECINSPLALSVFVKEARLGGQTMKEKERDTFDFSDLKHSST